MDVSMDRSSSRIGPGMTHRKIVESLIEAKSKLTPEYVGTVGKVQSPKNPMFLQSLISMVLTADTLTGGG